MAMMYLLLTPVIFVIITYWFLTRTFKYWEKQNVPCAPDPVPGFGHLLSVITLRESISEFTRKLYDNTSASMIGFYFMQRPAIVVRDPELVKSVLQTNFQSFRNNALNVDRKDDPVLAMNPFFTTDSELWKVTRARTVNHLSGRKLRQLSIYIQEVCSKMCDYVDRNIKKNGGAFECELKEHFSKYTGEIVANTAFAIQGQSFEDNPDRFSFTNVAKTLFEPTLFNGIKQALVFYLPSIARLFGMGFMQKKTDNYFRETLKAIIKQRQQENSSPNDYLQFCLDTNSEDDLDAIIADVIIFYGDLYETSGTTLTGVFYHLSQNPDVQEKLRAHIKSAVEATNGIINYDSLKNMNYLEQVISESMRLLTPLGVQMKVCTEEITIEGTDGLKCHLQPGNPVFIPVGGLHEDEKYWPDPLTFDPERFRPENQVSRNKYVFLPFGEGPRMCVGMRLGLLVVKYATASLITKYVIENSDKTKKPFEYDPTSFLLYIKGGLWAKFKPLN